MFRFAMTALASLAISACASSPETAPKVDVASTATSAVAAATPESLCSMGKRCEDNPQSDEELAACIETAKAAINEPCIPEVVALRICTADKVICDAEGNTDHDATTGAMEDCESEMNKLEGCCSDLGEQTTFCP